MISLENIAIVILSLIGIFFVYQYQNLRKLYTELTFFHKSYIVDNFRSVINTGWPYVTARHGQIAEFNESESEIKALPLTFTFKNRIYNLKEWLKSHWTTSLVILKVESPTKAKLLFESYYLGNTRQTKTISWSVGKSVVSALIGIAVAEHKIASVNDDVTIYAPQLKGTAYDGVKIVDVLQMSSGVSFTEDYDKIWSDINKMCYWLTFGFDYINFIRLLRREREPGTVHNYISIDTQILGMVLRGATNQSLTSYLEEKLWKRGGFESDCHWLIDNEKSAMRS